MDYKNITIFLLLSLIFSACDIREQFGSHDSTQEYVRVYLTSVEHSEPTHTRASWTDESGFGDLTFKWDKTDVFSGKAKNITFVISDGDTPLPAWNSPYITQSTTNLSYSWLATTPHSDNANVADFQTTRYYSQKDLKTGQFCFAVTGQTEVSEDIANGRHSFHMGMPSTFIQTKNQDPSFLKANMHMFATNDYTAERTALEFQHIPTTLRLIITNTGSEARTLKEVCFYTSASSDAENSYIASADADISFDWTTGEARLTYGEDQYNRITTIIEGKDALLNVGQKYTAYSMVLPLSEDNALKDKVLNFKITTEESEYMAYQLDCNKLAKVNKGNVCNWIGGNSYTIKLSLGDNAEIRGEMISNNTIMLFAETPGTYTLKYEDAHGQPLADHQDICTISADQFSYYSDFIDANCAPDEAETVGIYDINGNRTGEISIANFRHTSEEPLYSVGLLSDVHCEYDIRTESVSDFQRALSFFNANNVSMTCICGDITQNGTEEELELYQQIVTSHSPSTPVYTTSGNHDANSGIDEELWELYTGQPLVFEQSIELADGSEDHFLFIGMFYWAAYGPYLNQHISWLEEKLEEYKNERCFIITHLFFPVRAGNLNEIYPINNWLSGLQLEKLEGLCDKYINSIWFSGHSHWKWELQKYQDRANIHRNYNFNGQPSSGWCVHVPSCANPTNSDGISTRFSEPLESQGAILHIYKDHIHLQGFDFGKDKYLPIASYRLNTSLTFVP